MKNIRRSLPAKVRQEDENEMEDANVTTRIMRTIARTKGKPSKLMLIYIINSFKNYQKADGTKFYDGDGEPMSFEDVPQEIKDLGAHVFISYKDFLKTLKKDNANANISRKNIFKIIENARETACVYVKVQNNKSKQEESETKKSEDQEKKSYSILHVNLIHATAECGKEMADVVIDKFLLKDMEAFGAKHYLTMRTEMENVAKLSNGRTAGLYLDTKATLKEYPTTNKTTHNRAFFEIVIPWSYLKQDMEFVDENDEKDKDKHPMCSKGRDGYYILKKKYVLSKIQKSMKEIQEKTDVAFRGKPWFSKDRELKNGVMSEKGTWCVHLIATTRKKVSQISLDQRTVYKNEENDNRKFFEPKTKTEKSESGNEITETVKVDERDDTSYIDDGEEIDDKNKEAETQSQESAEAKAIEQEEAESPKPNEPVKLTEQDQKIMADYKQKQEARKAASAYDKKAEEIDEQGDLPF